MQNPPVPLYFTIKDQLIEQIENEEYKPNEPIASEKQLMEKYGVSRTTVRRAIELLVNDGYLYIVRGKGTFVREKKYRHSINSFSSCTEMLREMQIDPVVKVLHSQVECPILSIQKHLELLDGDRVFHLERVNYIDSIPVNFTKTFLPYKYMRGIEEYDFSVLSLYEILREMYGFEIVGADRTVEAVLPTNKIASILQITADTPILKFDAVVYGKRMGNTTRIETYKTYFRTDKIKFVIK